MVIVSSMYAALYSNRVFLLEPESPFRYANCTDQSWECYFQPLSRCTVNDTIEVAETLGHGYGSDLTNASARVLRKSKQIIGMADNGPWEWYIRGGDSPWWSGDILSPGGWVGSPAGRLDRQTDRQTDADDAVRD